tara:strand:- start:228 stop:794 length:567 start_codon:yes stop_codon:yes gene_type:complete
MMMFPIAFASIIGVAVIVERLLSLRVSKIAPQELRNLYATGETFGTTDFKGSGEFSSTTLGVIYSAINQYADLDKDELKEKVEEIAKHHIHEMYRYLDILSTISVATPLFGLLGTVLGMIDVFEQIYLAGVEDAPLLAGGISQALVSTAAGLSVAIPALLFHRFFSAKIEGLVVLIDISATKIIESLR